MHISYRSTNSKIVALITYQVIMPQEIKLVTQLTIHNLSQIIQIQTSKFKWELKFHKRMFCNKGGGDSNAKAVHEIGVGKQLERIITPYHPLLPLHQRDHRYHFLGWRRSVSIQHLLRLPHYHLDLHKINNGHGFSWKMRISRTCSTLNIR